MKSVKPYCWTCKNNAPDMTMPANPRSCKVPMTGIMPNCWKQKVADKPPRNKIPQELKGAVEENEAILQLEAN